MTAVARRRAALADVLAVAALAIVAVAAFERAVSRLYLLNFSTAGPNATAALALLLAGAPAVGAVGAARERGRALAGCVLATPLLLAVALAAPPVPALVAAVGVGFVTPPLFAVALARRPDAVAPGVALGLLALVTVRSAFDGLPPAATTPGRVALLAVAVVGAAGWIALVRRVDRPTLDADVAPLALAVVVEATFLGAPAAVAGWRLTPPAGATVGAAVGLAFAGAVVAVRGPPPRVAVPVLAAAALAAVADLLWPGLAAGAALGVAQACVVGLLARAAADARASPSRWPAATGWQLLAVCLLFLFVGSLNWAYMPAPLDALTRGASAPLLFGLCATVPAAASVTVRRAGRAESAGGDDGGVGDATGAGDATPAGNATGAGDATTRGNPGSGTAGDPPVDGDRRTVLACVGGALAGVGTVALPARRGGASPDATPLTVATYNVHQFLAPGDGAYALDALARTLRETDAGIVGLQESDGTRVTSGNVDGVRWLADALGYHYDRGAPTSAASYGVALLSAWPIREREVVPLPTHDSPRRLAMRAVVETPAGDVPVVVTHLQTQQGGDPDAVAAQGREAERVADLAGGDPRTIVLGDCNVTPGDDPAYRALADALTDGWAAAAERSAGTGDTFPADAPDERIDYVWTGAAWSVRSASVHGGWDASDHRAVSAVLEDPDQSV